MLTPVAYPAYPAPSTKALALYDAMVAFMREEVFAAEASYDAFRDAVLGAGYARSGGPSPRGE